MEKIYSAVVYTDGGCKPVPGYIGMGIHGYVFDNTKTTDKAIVINKAIVTDKGYLTATELLTKKLVSPIYYFDYSGTHDAISTNNAAEVRAMTIALEYLSSIEIEVDKQTIKLTDILKDIYILADSEYALRGFDRTLEIMEKHNWVKSDGCIVANVDEWKQALLVKNYYKDLSIPINFQWIRGHNGDVGNTIADMLATIGRNKSALKVLDNVYSFETAKQYWKTDVEINPFISKGSLLFSCRKEVNTPGEYFIINNCKKEEDIGKPMPTTSHTLVRVSEEDHYIKLIQDMQSESMNNAGITAVANINNLYNSNVLNTIDKYGQFALKVRNKVNYIEHLDGTSITHISDPTRHIFRAISVSDRLRGFLDEYTRMKNSSFSNVDEIKQIKFYDITDSFFIESIKKSKNKKDNSLGETETLLHPDLKSGVNSQVINLVVNFFDVEYKLSINVILGYECMARNNLKKIESNNPKVYLLTIPSSRDIMEYAIVIDSDIGSGVWCGMHTNRLIMRKN